MIPGFVRDGGTMPFYGIATYPPGAYDALTDTTWVVWESFSPTAQLRGLRIRGYDHSLEAWTVARSIATHPLTDDDHGVPSVCVDDEGHIHVFGGGHNSDVFHWSSDSPGDHTAWTLQHTFSGEYSYPHPVLVGTALWLILRETNTPGTKMPAVYFKTTALAAGVPTWGSENPLVDLGADSRVYVGNTLVDGTDIHFTATRANFADTSRQHAYHFVLDTTTGDVRNTSGGTVIDAGDLPVDLTEANASFRVHTHSGGNFGTLPSIAFDSSDVLHMVFADGTTNPVTIKHTRFTAGAWTSAASVGVGTDIGADAVHVSDPILVPLPAGEMAVYYSEDAATDWNWGGNIRRVVRSAGGSWGSSELIAEAVDRAYHQISAVAFAHADLRVIIAQRAQTDADTEGFDFKVYAHGDSGFVFADEPTQTLVRTTDGLIDYWNLNGAPDQWRSFATADWTAGSGNTLSTVALTGGNGLRVSRSGSGSATIGFVQNNDVSPLGQVYVYSRMVRSGENRFGITVHVTDVTAGSEDGVALNIRGATSAAGALLEYNAGAPTTVEATSNFSAATQNYSFALYANGTSLLGWDELTNNDYSGSTSVQNTGSVGLWRAIDSVGAFINVRQYFATVGPSLAVSNLDTSEDVELRGWDHTPLQTGSESSGTATLDLLKIDPHSGVQLAVVDGSDDRIVYDRVPGSGEFILGGNEYEVAYPPLGPVLAITPTHEAAALTIPDGFVPNPLDPDAVHIETVWQIARISDVDFEDPLLDVTVTSSLLAYVTEAILTASTDYHGRTKTNSTTVDGHWSAPVPFTTEPPLPTPEDPVLSDPPTNIEEDEVTLTVSDFEHAEGETTLEDYDPVTNNLPYPLARRWQVAEDADTGFSHPLIDTDLVSNIDLERTFGGLEASTTYRTRTLVQDGKYGTLSDWSNVVVFTTDATPVDRPEQPVITATCTGRGATLSATTFVPFGAETHALTHWRARPSNNSSTGMDAFQSAVYLTSFDGWTRLPRGTWLFDVRYKGSNGKWSLWSATDSCEVFGRPPAPVIESPVSGKVISAAQLITISEAVVADVEWNFVWQVRAEGGSWSQVQSSTSLTYNFPITGKSNGFWEVRVQACYPEGHDAEGVCSDWAVVKLRLDRTGIRAKFYSFVGLTDPDDIPGDPLLIWDNEDDDVTVELVDSDLRGEGPSAGLLIKNNRVLTTRQAILALRDLGKPVAGRFMTTFAIVPRETGVWWGWKYSHTHFMKAGVGYRALGTGATDRSGLQFVARSGVQPWPFYPQTTSTGGSSTGCVCPCPVTNDSCFCCPGDTCAPCMSCHGMPSPCTCVGAAADQAKRARTNGTALYEYGVSHGRGGLERYGRKQGSSSAFFYQDATLAEDGPLARGLEVSHTYPSDLVVSEETPPPCVWGFVWYTLEVDIAREGNQWRVRSRVHGPGIESDDWAQDSLIDLGETGGPVPCGYCGIALHHLRSNLTDDHGILFRSFAASDLEYEDCEPPEDVPTGCDADWRFTMFEDDDVTPWYGTADEDGNVIEADFYDNRACPRPYLMAVKNFSETEIDYPAGASTIGQITVGVLDKRLTASDQNTGIVTARIKDAIGRRGVLERWREDLGYVTVFDGVVESVQMDEEIVVWLFNLRDPRERERETALFTRNETFALYPEDGPVEAYGLLPNDQGNLLHAAQTADGVTFARLSGVGGGPGGVHYGVVILSERTEAYKQDVLFPLGAATYNGTSGYYEFREITVRWRPAAGGSWTYLRNMPSSYVAAGGQLVTNAIIPPGNDEGSWRLFMSSLDTADVPDNSDSIDFQILAAKTTDKTPFFWDAGTAGDLLLAIYDGDFTEATTPPRIRYSLERLTEWALETPRMRFIVREPAKNMREWVQENIFAAIGWAPSFDEDMRIVPSEWELPPSDEELVELDADWIVPVGDFTDEKSSVVNRVTYTYIRESVIPEESGGFGSVLQQAVRGLYGDSDWTRLVEEKVTREYIFEPSMFLGENAIDYAPITVRSTGTLGEALTQVLGVETADVIADKIGNNVLSRFGWGAFEFICEVRSGMAHGPGFDPYTLDLAVGDWVIATVDWLPEYSIGERNMRRYMQIKSITDPEIHIRRLRLIDGGPVLIGEEGESDEGEEDVLPSPTIGTLEETEDQRVEIPIFLPTNAPTGENGEEYTVRVDYAVGLGEPDPNSGDWILAGYLTADGSVFTPVLPSDAVVWVRARGELMGRRPTPWTASSTLTLAQTPALLTLTISFASESSGLVQLNWTPNDFCGGVEVEVSTGTIGHTPSFGAFDEVDADDGTLNLTGEEIGYGEELYARVTAWETFAAGNVGGDEGVQYTKRITRPEPADSADHALGDHTDTDFVPPEDRTTGMVPMWIDAESDEPRFTLQEVPQLPIDINADTTGTLTVARGGTGLTALGSTLQLLRTNAAATLLEWWTLVVNLATQVSGLLGRANGGTGVDFSSLTGHGAKLLRANVAETAFELWTLTVNAASQITGVLPEANGGVPAGGNAGQVLTKDSNSDHDASWQTPGTTSGTLSARATRTAGSVSTVATHTNYQTFDSGTDLVLAAVAGDVIEVGASIRWAGSETGTPQVDAVSWVSGAAVNYMSGAGSGGAGVQAWIGPNGVAGQNGGSIQYVVQSGDLSGGNITIRLLFKNSTANARTIVATAANPFHWHAKNLRQ